MPVGRPVGRPINNFHSGFVSAQPISRAHPLPRSRSVQAWQPCIMPPISMTVMSLKERPPIFRKSDAGRVVTFHISGTMSRGRGVSRVIDFALPNIRRIINFSSTRLLFLRRNPLHVSINILRPNIRMFVHWNARTPFFWFNHYLHSRSFPR